MALLVHGRQSQEVGWQGSARRQTFPTPPHGRDVVSARQCRALPYVKTISRANILQHRPRQFQVRVVNGTVGVGVRHQVLLDIYREGGAPHYGVRRSWIRGGRGSAGLLLQDTGAGGGPRKDHAAAHVPRGVMVPINHRVGGNQFKQASRAGSDTLLHPPKICQGTMNTL